MMHASVRDEADREQLEGRLLYHLAPIGVCRRDGGGVGICVRLLPPLFPSSRITFVMIFDDFFSLVS